MTRKKFTPILYVLVLLITLAARTFINPGTAEAARAITFPVVGSVHYSDDYYSPRGTGIHHAIDIIANKGLPLVSAINGTITDVQVPQPSWGYSVTVRDDSGYKYTYIHMNDDRPGTNDGKGGPMNAYAPYVKEGNRVYAGQQIGKVGDSGNSNGVSHLHFEMRAPDGSLANPFKSLNGAKRISKPVSPPPINNEMLPYGPGYTGGVNVSMGNLDADQDSEFVTGAGAGGGPHVKIYESDGMYLKGFFAYNSTFRGGVDVAMGDIDQDGEDEIITGAGAGGGPHVKVFKKDGTSVTSFFAYDSTGRYGIRVAAGDVNGDGRDEIITGIQAGTEPTVKVFDMTTGSAVLTKTFNAYAALFGGGVDVASGDVVGTPEDEIVTTPSSFGGPQVKVFDGNGNFILALDAYSHSSVHGGVRVSVGNVNILTPKSEILTVPTQAATPVAKMFSSDGTTLTTKPFLEEWWIGFYDVGAGFDTSKLVTGTNRRGSLMLGID